MATTDTNEVYETARRLIGMGISVIPIMTGSKEPPYGFRWGEYGNRLADASELWEWFIRLGYRNLAVLPGTISSWLKIVDFDGDGGYASYVDHYPDATRWTRVETGSGKDHLWVRSDQKAAYARFEAPDGSVAELRNNMHYTVCPPSIHPNGRPYRWVVPPWSGLVDVDLAAHGLPVKPVGPEDALPFTPGEPLTDGDIARIRDALVAAWQPGRHHDLALAVAGYLAGYRVPQQDTWAILYPLVDEYGGDRRDIRRCVTDTYRKAGAGVSVAGWAKLTDRDIPLLPSSDAVTLDGLMRSRRPEFTLAVDLPPNGDLPLLLPAAMRERERPYPFVIGARQLLEEPDEGDSMLIDGVIRTQVVAWIAGPPRTYKSFIMMGLGVALAAGVRALGAFHVEEPKTVVYLQEEGSRRDVRRRLRAIIRGYGLLPANVEPNLLVVTNERWRLDNDEDVRKLIREVIIPYRPALIMLDPYRNLHHTDENSADAQMALMERLLYLRDEFGCSFLVCHHFGKEDLEGRKRREGDELRGSSVLWAAAAGGLLVYPSNQEHTIRMALLHKEGVGRREVLIRLGFAPDPDDDGGTVGFTVMASGDDRTTTVDMVLETLTQLHATIPGGWPTADQVAAALGLQPRTVQNKLGVLVQSHQVVYQGAAREKRRYAPTEDADADQPAPATAPLPLG